MQCRAMLARRLSEPAAERIQLRPDPALCSVSSCISRTCFNFHACMQSLGLSRGEALQVLNTLPRTPVEVHLLLTNCEERLGEPGTDALLNAVNEFLPQPLPAQEQQEVQAEE